MKKRAPRYDLHRDPLPFQVRREVYERFQIIVKSLEAPEVRGNPLELYHRYAAAVALQRLM